MQVRKSWMWDLLFFNAPSSEVYEDRDMEKTKGSFINSNIGGLNRLKFATEVLSQAILPQASEIEIVHAIVSAKLNYHNGSSSLATYIMTYVYDVCPDVLPMERLLSKRYGGNNYNKLQPNNTFTRKVISYFTYNIPQKIFDQGSSSTDVDAEIDYDVTSSLRLSAMATDDYLDTFTEKQKVNNNNNDKKKKKKKEENDLDTLVWAMSCFFKVEGFEFPCLNQFSRNDRINMKLSYQRTTNSTINSTSNSNGNGYYNAANAGGSRLEMGMGGDSEDTDTDRNPMAVSVNVAMDRHSH